MKKIKQTNALRNVLSILSFGLLAVCMVLGFGISEMQAQFVSPANFYNQVDGVLTNEVDVAPGDTINYLIGVNSEGGIDGVTITMNFDPTLMQIQDGDVIDEVGPLFNFPVDEEVINPDGYFTFSKALIESFYQGSTPFISVNLIISNAITQTTTTTIDHILDDAVVLRSQIALYGNALLADADAPSLTINIIVPVDCPGLGLNIGDACDDGDANTENDMVNDNCDCVGTPIVNFDCPTLQASIGDACDDGDANTQNDMVTTSCDCVGTPIVTFDCPALGLNIGNACDDGNPITINDTITDNCDCIGITDPALFCPNLDLFIGDACDDGDEATVNDIVTVNCDCTGYFITTSPACSNWVYYLADHSAADGISDIFGVSLSGSTATMTYIATSDIEVHIAYNTMDNLIYAVSKHENSYRTLDPTLEVWGPTVLLGYDYGEITTAAFNADGKLVIGSQDLNATYSVNIVTNVVSLYDSFSPIYGGDMAFATDGMLFLATRSGNGLYENYSAPTVDNLLGSVPSLVTGLAITESNQLLVSAQGNSSLALYNYDGSSAGVNYDLFLNEFPYTLRDGDMTSGCVIVLCDCSCPDMYFTTFYVDHGPGINGSNLYTIDFEGGNANLTYVTNVDFEAQIAFKSDNGILYLVNADGPFIRFYDVNNDVFLGDLPLSGSFTKITAVVYNPADGLLYIGDDNTNAVFTIDLNTGNDTFYANAPVSGGDLEILENGDIYLATKAGNNLYLINGGAPTLIGSIPNGVTGMSRVNDVGSVMLSNSGANVFTRINTVDASPVATYNVILGGSPFTLSYGDMAAGCYFPSDPKPGISAIEADVNNEITSFPNPTTGQSNVVFITTETGRTLVEVYDMSGRNVATIFNAEAQQGKEYRLDFDGAALPNGVYIYRLTTQNETIVEKFMIAR